MTRKNHYGALHTEKRKGRKLRASEMKEEQQKLSIGTSLAAQQLRLCASNAEGHEVNPGSGN